MGAVATTAARWFRSVELRGPLAQPQGCDEHPAGEGCCVSYAYPAGEACCVSHAYPAGEGLAATNGVDLPPRDEAWRSRSDRDTTQRWQQGAQRSSSGAPGPAGRGACACI